MSQLLEFDGLPEIVQVFTVSELTDFRFHSTLRTFLHKLLM
jgi:hypothetical protein